jgi:putative nucleotidyltransferase with HDIG domain
VQKIQQIEQYVRDVMAHVARPDLQLAHDFKHVDRVRGWALIIAEREGGAEREVVEATALLHDIGLAYVEHRRDHARVGAERAAQFLREQQFFRASEIIAIADAIRCHSSLQGGGHLGALLRDADMLDLFGAIGIMRAFTSKYSLPEYDPQNVKGATWNMTALEFTDRFRSGMGMGAYIVDQLNFQLSCYDNLTTTTAKAIAQPLVAFAKAYLVQLDAEVVARNHHDRP